MIYAADLEGKITKINLTDNGNMFTIKLLYLMLNLIHRTVDIFIQDLS